MKINISVCIPVYNTESFLEDCLVSVCSQTFKNYEIVVVNDYSKGLDKTGRNCKEIVQAVYKKYKVHITYLEHSENKGLLEARRTAIYAAKGRYIFNLDSDDKLPNNALDTLFNVAIENRADIVHGKVDLFSIKDFEHTQDNQEQYQAMRNIKLQKVSKVVIGAMENKEIFDSYLIKRNHCGFLCGKLFKRELYLEAFNMILPMFCTMAEDVIQYFWITYFAKKYIGIDKVVYHYCDNTGITANKQITDIDEWKRTCSVASVFTGLFTSISEDDIQLSIEEKQSISFLCVHYVKYNLKKLFDDVTPNLREKAFGILCDYWGEELVKRVLENKI